MPQVGARSWTGLLLPKPKNHWGYGVQAVAPERVEALAKSGPSCMQVARETELRRMTGIARTGRHKRLHHFVGGELGGNGNLRKKTMDQAQDEKRPHAMAGSRKAPPAIFDTGLKKPKT